MDIFKCRASAIGIIMTNGRGTKEMGDTCKSYLQLWHREQKWNRHKDIETKYMTKGISEEQSAIDLLSFEDGKAYFKNTFRFENDYLTGNPDLIDKEGIVMDGDKFVSCKHGLDTKCSYTWTTLPFESDGNDPKYDYQNMGYMDLTGAEIWETCYCLVNSSGSTIDDEKRRMAWRINCIDTEHSEQYIYEGKEIEKNHIYDLKLFLNDNPGYDLLWDEKDWIYDIKRSERLVKFVTLRDQTKIDAIYKRVEECRVWIKQNLE